MPCKARQTYQTVHVSPEGMQDTMSSTNLVTAHSCSYAESHVCQSNIYIYILNSFTLTPTWEWYPCLPKALRVTFLLMLLSAGIVTSITAALFCIPVNRLCVWLVSKTLFVSLELEVPFPKSLWRLDCSQVPQDLREQRSCPLWRTDHSASA